MSLEAILKGSHEVAEGVTTTPGIVALGARYGVELPIASQVEAVLYGGRPPLEAVESLMARQPRAETD
jgi:glycerol-3-phosphate dehydrogenase (NAD(P)+)